jgi:hypothetical protein
MPPKATEAAKRQEAKPANAQKAEKIDPPKLDKVLYDKQKQAPAPNQTYYQIVITESKAILRDWPRMRASIKNLAVFNPGSKTISHREFLDGEWNNEIEAIFGKEELNKMKNAILDKSVDKEVKSKKQKV